MIDDSLSCGDARIERDGRRRAPSSAVAGRTDAAALARRAGVSQSVVAAYESGTREPSLVTLATLVEATGISLDVDLGPALPVPTTPAP